ncbi:tripartite tricarboxylate transporter substrate binding protein [Falsiroseomonas bella]|uniref:Tripartite tricarboxylate transporter substrate binding protein n=1 Tax=Falsiroseomonas bella TaxID=2184016 RepID=A0A317FD55_9PROT|nr:tripartite tricarboxylate transporter substrate binding protein [Falsiroseomonas bella]PWS35456.1 tripartite tricarboxylate transporter substrate binding protein [Falsiroseomonas bella]
MTLTRRGVLGAATLAALPGTLAAQPAWPDRPVRVIVAFPGGSTPDMAARAVTPHLQQVFGQPFVVDNRAGGGGNIGTEAIARASDGHTFGVTIGGPGSTAKVLNPALSFDPATDLSTISLLARLPFVLAVHPSVPANTVAELLAYARANPGKLNYGSTGPGTLSHLATEDMAARENFRAEHVSYRGVAPAVLDLVAGRLQLFFAPYAGVAGQVRDGQLRALAVTGPGRMPQLPDVPTLREAGVQMEPVVAWIGLFGPAGTPADRASRIAQECRVALNQPEQRRVLEAAGFEPVGSTPAEFAALQKAEIERWGGLIRRLGIRPES